MDLEFANQIKKTCEELTKQAKNITIPKKMDVKIVLGTFFGDEGKGVTVQWLCQQALNEGKSVVVERFSGGPQAAHTIRHHGIEHICSTYGAGVLLGIPTYLTEGCMFDPICAYNEANELVEKIGSVENLLYVSKHCRIITPFDTHANMTDSKVLEDGTCGKGIYHTFKRYDDWNHTRSLSVNATQNIAYTNPTEYFSMVYDYYKDKLPNADEIYNEFKDAFVGRLTFWAEMGAFNPTRDSEVIILEGSQGLLLDMEHGWNYPHLTPTKVGLNGVNPIYLDRDDLFNTECYLVMRSYMTRHGNGYEPKPLPVNWQTLVSKSHETNVLNAYQGRFKVGVLESSMFAKSVDRHNLDMYHHEYGIKFNLVMTHMDCIPSDELNEKGLPKILCEIYDSCKEWVSDTIYLNGTPNSHLLTVKM